MLAPWVRRHWLLKHSMIAAQQSCGNKTPTQHLVGLGNFEEPGAVVSQRESWAPKTSTPESNRTETQISGRDFPLWILENHAQIGWTIMRSYPGNWERPKKVWKPCGENWSDPQQRQQDPESLFPAFLSAPHTVTHRFLMVSNCFQKAPRTVCHFISPHLPKKLRWHSQKPPWRIIHVGMHDYRVGRYWSF